MNKAEENTMLVKIARIINWNTNLKENLRLGYHSSVISNGKVLPWQPLGDEINSSDTECNSIETKKRIKK